ncbi:hypothetical protein Goe21_02950 [Bacillus phage vB_BsuM-Goe21]|nr:hypothetical protein Goe21_02950 [Bacillus phage vB_BsuM-Goe21]
MATTSYKVGDRIKGSKSGFYLIVKQVLSNGDIKVQCVVPKGNEKYYTLAGGKRTSIGSSYVTIKKNMKVTLTTVKYDYKEQWINPAWYWYGNKYDGVMNYGTRPYTKISKGSKAAPKSQTNAQLFDATDLSKKWTPKKWVSIPGTYQWANSTSNGDWSGWYKGSWYLAVHNTYRRPIKFKVKLKTPDKISRSATVNITGIRSIADKTKPNIDLYDKRSNKNILIPNTPETYTVYKPITVFWKEDTSKFKYDITAQRYTDIDGNTSNFTFTNYYKINKYGTYEVAVRCTNKDTPSLMDFATSRIIYEDPTPAPDFKIFDKAVTSRIYDEYNKVYLAACYPTINVPSGCTLYEAKINGKAYTLGTPLVENGTYTIVVTIRKNTNHKTLTKKGVFTIDNDPPDPPIIRIDKDYQGKDYGLIGRFPNPVSPRIIVQSGCVPVTKVYYKKDLNDTQWVQIPEEQTYSKKGIYRIESKAHKLSNGLYSEYTTVEFYKKIKYRYTITLDPNELCYRTIATVNFPKDPTMKFQYRINDGDWRWYRDPVKIYKNCIIYVRSLDGDDDYESYITSKIVDIIDTTPPDTPVIGGVSEGDAKSTVIPTIEG